MSRNTIEIHIKSDFDSRGTDQASHGVSSFGQGLGNMLAVAGGNLIADAMHKTFDFIGGIGRTAFESVAHLQNLEIALEGLLAQGLAYQQVTESQSVAIRLTQEETMKLADLTAQRGTLTARMQEQKQRVWEMTNLWTEEGLATQTARARLAEMEVDLTKTNQAIAELTSKQGSYATVTETSWKQTMEFADAQKIAKVQAQDLLGYVQKLAIQSPFKTSQVEMVAKIGVASGLSAEKVKEFTGAFMDYSAVAGITSNDLAFAANQFLQLKRIGHLSIQDLRQLSNLGIDVSRILGVKLGLSVEQFNEKLKTSPELMDQLIDGFVEFAKETSGGAAERMSFTLTGLMSTLADIVEVGAANLFTPLADAIGPVVGEMLGNLTNLITGPGIFEAGQRLADKFMAGFTRITEQAKGLFAAFQEGGMGGLVDALGISPGVVAAIQQAGRIIGDAIAFIVEHAEAFKGALIGIGIALGGMAIVGTIAGIAATIAALANPITLIIGAAALLGAAWAENWFGIQDVVAKFWFGIAQPVFREVVTWLERNIPAAIRTASDFFERILTPAIGKLLEFFTPMIRRLVSGFQEFLAALAPLTGKFQEFLPTLGTSLGLWGRLAGVVGGVLLVAIKALGEAVGFALPYIGQIISTVVSTALDLMTRWVDFLATTLVPWLEINLPVAIAALSEFWTGTLQPALEAVWTFITTSLVPAMVDVWNWLSTNIPVAIQTVSDFWTGTLQPALEAVWTFITTSLVPAFSEVGTWLSTTITTAIQTGQTYWDALVTTLTAVWNFIDANILPVFAAIGNVLGAVVDLALTASAGLWQNVLQPALEAVWDFISANILPIFESVSTAAEVTVGGAVTGLAAIWQNVLQPALEKIWGFIQDNILPILQALADMVRDTAGPALDWLKTTVIDALAQGLEGIKTVLGDVTEFLNNLATGISNIQLPPWLQPGSPTPFETGLLGIGAALVGPVQAGLLLMTQLVVILGTTSNAVIMVLQAQLANLLLLGIQPVDFALISISTITLPALLAAVIGTASISIAQMQAVQAAVLAMTEAVNAGTAAFSALGVTATGIGAAIDAAMKVAKEQIESLKSAVDDAKEAFDKMAAAAQAAAKAAADAGSNTGAAGGPGFQHGTHGIRTIPAGFGNDSYRIGLTSGEQYAVAPAGQSLRDMIRGGDRNVTYNFNQTVITRAESSTVRQDFETMKSLIGA